MIEDALGSLPVAHRETVFSGRVWDVERHTVDLPSGSTIVRDLLDHPGAVAVLAVNERDEVLLVHQYRHPVGATMWELPAGLLDVEGEDPLVGAQRELAEETDTVAATWGVLCDISTSGGGSSEVLRIYLATDVSDASETFARTDEEAEMQVRWVPLAEVVDAALSMRLHNATMLTAVLAYEAMRARGGAPAPADVPFDWHRPARPER
ncbi:MULTISPECIES: NUDIX domain-containing protein [unclassified Agrococcus]|uniref:NUDIX domain-containing protein n=1 Tax=unclassified Agrococcus TaxID=2615065 RepID=UPI00360BB694